VDDHTALRTRPIERQLRARTTGNANLARGHNQELSALKLLSVFLEHSIEVFDFGLQGSSWKPKENDAGVDEFLVKNQLTKIAISNDQNTLFFSGDC
jgi:hypothetical protein